MNKAVLEPSSKVWQRKEIIDTYTIANSVNPHGTSARKNMNVLK
jgi:hypothetical protein